MHEGRSAPSLSLQELFRTKPYSSWPNGSREKQGLQITMEEQMQRLFSQELSFKDSALKFPLFLAKLVVVSSDGRIEIYRH